MDTKCSVTYWYAYARSAELGHEHYFTTDKDTLPADCLYVKRIETDHPGKLWALVQQYARQNDDYVLIENSRITKEYWRGLMLEQRLSYPIRTVGLYTGI